MRVSCNWIRDYVDFDISYEELAKKLTMAGLEVDTIEYLGQDVSNIFVGEVKDVEKHPNADKLSLCTVDVNDENKDLKIICGAPNVAKGQKVVVALPGATLPNNIKIRKAKIRGIESNGMICSGQELGMDEDLIPEEQRNGILVLDEDIPIGTDAKKVLGLDDVIFVLELTPNRSDCYSLINVAKEVAAITGNKMKLPQINMEEEDSNCDVEVEILDPDLCERYIARVVKNVTIASSPMWMQKRLQACGVRPINNVVDVTNYVMLEMGQPLHAFDYDYIEDSKIIVRRAQVGEQITTLDGKERKLQNEMLVIADPKKPVAIAGVMGGANSEVTDNSKDIIIEAAYFNPISIRRTSKKLNLRSEASMRFEKGIDKERVLIAANRAVQLLAQLAGGTIIKDYVDNYPVKYTPIAINLRVSRVNSIIGIKLSSEEIKELLEKIELKVETMDEETMTVSIPSHRGDITSEIDLIEEVARLYGYDNIPTTMPAGTIKGVNKTKKQAVESIIRDTLVSCGSMEVITYSFINPKSFDKINIPDDSQLKSYVKISNPLSEDGSVMRTTLLPNLLEVYVKNKSRRIENVNIFELGRVFYPTNDLLPKEQTNLAVLVAGESWKGWGWNSVPMDFYFVKGIIEQVFENLGIKPQFKQEKECTFLHPGRTAKILIGEKSIGVLGEIAPYVKENYDIDGNVYFLEVNLEDIINEYDQLITYQELPKYPSVERDLAIVIKEDITAEQVEEIIKNTGGELLKEVHLFDIYRGKQVQEGHKSLAFSLTYQSYEKTLTDVEVNEIHAKIQNELSEKLGAQLR